ncbi:hypothetical protein PIROE2DRAFT_67582 [Piromyces sp. E2]|nr:hypothetical protein PIROE2DRAFT_67582 [Piromyces sp. E2]|eukprot:OUM60945.1 hypothetical protein PIROE2DRAFT_67582 [Piromyces sp. E2]
MKFSTVVVALAAATSAYAQTVAFDFAKFSKDANSDCKADVNKYADCLIKPTSGDYKERCKVIKSDTCTKFYGNADKYLSHCIGSESVTSLINPEKVAELQKDYTNACKKFKDAEKKTTTTTTTKTKTKTTTVAASTTAAATTSAAATESTSTDAATATNAAANNSTGNLENVVAAGNNTAPAQNNAAPAQNTTVTTNNNQSSDATKLTAASFLATIALVMLTFY